MTLPSGWSLSGKDRAALIGAVLLPGGLLLGAGWLIYRWRRSLRHRSPAL